MTNHYPTLMKKKSLTNRNKDTATLLMPDDQEAAEILAEEINKDYI